MKLLKILLAACLATLASTSSAAVVLTTDTSVVNSIPGITGFTTNGAMMDGLKVSVNFIGGFSETLYWADTGPTAGGVSGNGWSLSTSGDTFSADWVFAIDANRGQLLSFMLDASGPNQVTLFDTTFGVASTVNSASGKNFVFSAGCGSCNANAHYSNAVAIAPGLPAGDVFHTLTVDFTGGSGPRTGFSFLQDSDNDSRIVTGFVPEPGTVPMIVLALGAMGALLRRRR